MYAEIFNRADSADNAAYGDRAESKFIYRRRSRETFRDSADARRSEKLSARNNLPRLHGEQGASPAEKSCR